MTDGRRAGPGPAAARRAGVRRRAGRAGHGRHAPPAAAAGGCRRGPSSPTCWAARCPTAPSSRRSTSAPGGSSRWRWPRWPPTGRCCCSACPGTAKTWLSEHLAAAISGDSTLLVQGTAGTPEEALRYGWNYARLLTEGPSEQALVPSPVLRAMRAGSLVRVEELTRIPSDVQDALITILSEKTLPDPGARRWRCRPSRASTSSPPPTTATAASTSCPARCAAGSTPWCCRCRPPPRRRWPSSSQRVAAIGRALELPELPAADAEIRRVVTVFRELRAGVTDDGRISLKAPTATLSPAEAISVRHQRPVAGRALRRRRAAGGRPGRQHRRRGGQGPGARRRGLAGVPGGGHAGPDGWPTSTAPAARR